MKPTELLSVVRTFVGLQRGKEAVVLCSGD